jgi:hypothetical protein
MARGAHAVGAIITLLAIVTLSLLVNRIATVALVFTGVSKDLARFQARSAFTGSGFTTSESEMMMQHPVRRRIVMILMFAGSVGFVTILASGITGFVAVDRQQGAFTISEPIPIELHDAKGNVLTGVIKPTAAPAEVTADPENWYSWVFGVSPHQEMTARFLVLALGLIILYLIASSKWIDQVLFRVIGWAITRFTSLDTHDYEGLLHLGEGYAVVDVVPDRDHWITGQSLAELRLGDEGVQVLSIHRGDGTFIAAPRGDTFIRQGDKISIWGQAEHLCELQARRATREGELEHEQRVREQEEAMRQEGDARSAGSLG